MNSDTETISLQSSESATMQHNKDYGHGNNSLTRGIIRDLSWLYETIEYILNFSNPEKKPLKIPEFPTEKYSDPYDKFLTENIITREEQIILLLGIIPHIIPSYFNQLLKSETNQIQYPHLGGVLIGDEKNFWPTVETALCLLSEHSLERRFKYEVLFTNASRLIQNNWINLDDTDAVVPVVYKRINATDELLALIKGEQFRPDYTSSFPASYITTKLDWEDLVLPYNTITEVKELKTWLQFGDEIMQHPELGKKIKPGYRTLFYGPPGTGKTLTASLLGKANNLDVYRIDLSMVVSKWVGETEKNLKKVFDLAENKNWILFFDEADSIFGKRTQSSSSNDRYANQEVSYLLQRIEDFPGMIILASNLKNNIDEAFNRRFQSMVYFPMPDAEMRYVLWEKAFPSDFELDQDIDLTKISEMFELAGGAIINVIRYCVLKTLERKNKVILLEDIEEGVLKEYRKSGKIMN